ncbi:MAG: PDZ domain-containing protein [Gemmataceae bacterium]|nr:PDZ domain-containing protein [Gemmataceae bacterium]
MSLSFPGRAAAAGLVAALVALSVAAQDKKPDAPKPKFDPKDVQVGPPPELAALRAAVEEAAKKGENVDEIRARLEALEKALAGRAWARPKAAPEPAPRPGRPPEPFRQPDPLMQVPNPPNLLGGLGGLGGLALPPGGLGGFGGLGGGGQVDPADLLKAQELLLKATMLASQEPVDEKAVEALRKEAQDLLAKALGGQGGAALLPGLEALGGLNNLNGLGGLGGFDLPPPAKPRLGVTVEPANVDLDREEGVPAGRGVRVVEVVPGMPAAKAGLKRGDVIVEFAGRAVPASSQNFVRMVQQTKAGLKVDIAYVRDGKRQTAKGVALQDGGE